MRFWIAIMGFVIMPGLIPGSSLGASARQENFSFLETPHVDELDLKDEATVEAWIIPKSVTAAGDTRIVDKAQTMNSARGGFYLALGIGNTPVFYSAAGDLRSKERVPAAKRRTSWPSSANRRQSTSCI